MSDEWITHESDSRTRDIMSDSFHHHSWYHTHDERMWYDKCITLMMKEFYRSLLQNIVSLIGLFCKRDLSETYQRMWYDKCITLMMKECGMIMMKECGVIMMIWKIWWTQGGKEGDVKNLYQNIGHTSQRPISKYRSLLQNIVSLIGLFCKRDLSFYRSY